MVTKERRSFPHRPKSVNLVYFAVYDDKNTKIQQGMGKTLNISQGGILLETRERIIDNGNLIVSLALKNEIVDLGARVAHFLSTAGGVFNTGLSFIEVDAVSEKKIEDYINLFDCQGNIKE